jgi:hypothetical protein
MRTLLHNGVVRKRINLLRCHFIYKMIVIPRQARDKHRESTQKKSGVSAGAADDGAVCAHAGAENGIFF